MASTDPRLIDDPEYVQGQIAALRALVLGLANLLVSREDFRDQGLERLEVLRTALLSTQASDAHLLAIDDAENWLKRMTG